jgi:hypothetical protein
MDSSGSTQALRQFTGNLDKIVYSFKPDFFHSTLGPVGLKAEDLV